MGIHEALEGGNQPPPLRAAIIGIGGDADHLELAAIMALDHIHDLGRYGVMADIG